MNCPSCGRNNPIEASFCMACGSGLAATSEPVGKSPDELAASSGFVGRQREMGALRAALDNALSGQGSLVMLAGEPGIGKTRTAQEMTAIAQARGFQALWSRCYEDEGAPPYWPWVQSLRSHIQRQTPELLQAQLGPGAADIAEIVPEVKQKLPNLQPPAPVEPEQARFHLFASITTFLKNAAQSQPLLLVLDDLHWADRSSLLLLESLTRETQASPLLVLGAYRDVEVSRRHPLSETLGNLIRESRFLRIQLRGLARQEVEQLIQKSVAASPAPALAAAVHQRTEGNPLFVTEIIRMLPGEGIEGSQDYLTSIPEGVRDAIGQRLNRLSEGCNQVLAIASVIGREFDFQLLRALADDLNETTLLGLVEEALGSHVLEELPEGKERYQFSHALIQETLAQEMSTSRKIRLHARIGEALEEIHGANAPAHASELAYHFAEAQPALGPEKLVHYSSLAGEQALAAYAWEEALAHFQRGLAAKGTSAGNEVTETARDADEAELLFGLGRAQLALLARDRLHEALASLERSFGYYADAGDVASAVKVAEYPLPRAFSSQNKVEPRIERGLSLAPPDSLAAGRLLPIYGLELGRFENDYARAQEAFERALDIARREGDPGLEMRALAAWAQVDYFHLHLEECLGRSLRVVELAGETDDYLPRVIGHLHALQTLIHLGDRQQAEEQITAGLALAERLNSRPWLVNVLRCGVNLYRFLGDWDGARRMAARHLSLEQTTVPLLKEMASLEYELGQFQKGEDYLKQMQEIMRRTPPRPGPDYADTSLVSHHAGRMTGSTVHLELAREAAAVILSSPLAQPFWIEIARTGLALGAAQTGDAVQAEEQYLALARLPGRMRGSYIAAGRLLGLLARTMGNVERAAAHFEEALAFCRMEGWRPELAWTCHDYAETLLAGAGFKPAATDTDHIKVTSLLAEAVAISSELGMRPLLDKATALRESLEGQPARTIKYPANMTERQWQVLRLLAQGKTNREIAQALVLSERTVQRHIADIYDKIGARNRSEATAFAMSQSHHIK